MSDAKLEPAPKHGTLKFLLDFGPLVAWLIANKFLGIITGVAVFMAAISLSLIVSRWKLKRISPMLWLTAVLVLGFGSLTLLTRSVYWIQLKPTIVYLLLASVLFVGLFTGKAFIKTVLEYGYAGLSERGWYLLTRNWACFFVFLALVNEVMRHLFPGQDPVTGVKLDDNMTTWLNIKVWGVTALSMAFAMANLPMLMRHGLGSEEETETETPSQ